MSVINFEPPPFDEISSGYLYPPATEVTTSFNVTLNATFQLWAISNSTVIPETTPRAYYGDFFLHFNNKYRLVHGPLSLGLCVFGIIANVLNIIVLTRKNMISPTNAILTGMVL